MCPAHQSSGSSFRTRREVAGVVIAIPRPRIRQSSRDRNLPAATRDDAEAVLAACLGHGLEGVVGKPLASRYHPGGRRDWIEVKNLRHQEVSAAAREADRRLQLGERHGQGRCRYHLFMPGHHQAGSLRPSILVVSVARIQPGEADPHSCSGSVPAGQHLEVRRREKGMDASFLAGQGAWTGVSNGCADAARRWVLSMDRVVTLLLEDVLFIRHPRSAVPGRSKAGWFSGRADILCTVWTPGSVGPTGTFDDQTFAA